MTVEYCLILRIFVGTFSAIDAPGGFLFEWWSVFWDIFIARTNEKHSEVAASYIEVCLGDLPFFVSLVPTEKWMLLSHFNHKVAEPRPSLSSLVFICVMIFVCL